MSPSGPLPGPQPAAEGRTHEQSAALAVGGAFLLLGLLSALEVAWRVTTARVGLVVVVLPVLYLALGWLALLFGMARLSGPRRKSSHARGPWLVIGLLVFLLCAPLAASFAYPTSFESTTFTCRECGTQVRAEGNRNYWGTWLQRDLTVLGGPNPGCAHPGHLPWEE